MYIHREGPQQQQQREQQELGFEGLLRALATARAVKAQVDAMDVLKERLKKRRQQQPEAAAAGSAAGGEMEAGYLLMLRLYLHPRAAALRKVGLTDQRGVAFLRGV